MMDNLPFSAIVRMRNRHLFAIDFIALSLAPLASLILRCENFTEPAALAAPLLLYTLVSLVIKIGVSHGYHIYNRYWRYASVDEIAALVKASVVWVVLCITVFLGVLKPSGLVPARFPNSIPFIDAVLSMMAVGGLRVAVRLMYVFNDRSGKSIFAKRVLIAGAGVAGSMIVKEMRANPQLSMEPVGFIDDAPSKQHVYIHGIEVMGTRADIARIVRAERIAEVIIAMPTASGKVIRDVVEACKKLNVKSKTIPGVFEILSGSTIAQLRDVQIEDLLRRDIVTIEEREVEHLIHGARVMVTGAGGSIGSELCRQIARFRPKELVLLGHGENSIFSIANELKTKHGLILGKDVRIRTAIADIRDRARMDSIVNECRPEIIFHAAAHKHVGLMEVNVPDAVTNNVLGTQNLVELADRYDVRKFVLISSDKAVNPMCVMGATKRAAELVVSDAYERCRRPYVSVRFGNVLGSRGSVVPIFKEQIRNGGPVTITHPDVSRFFMTIPEAVRLVLQAGTLGKGGETFVLDMGEPVKIADLARDLIRLSGLQEGHDLDIVFTGLIGGEKMHEELFYGHERPEKTTHEKIMVCLNGHDDALKQTFSVTIGKLLDAAKQGNGPRANALLKMLIPQYCNPALGAAGGHVTDENDLLIMFPSKELAAGGNVQPA